MRSAFCCSLLFTGLLSAQSLTLLSLDELVGDWKVSKQFTIDVAMKMPPSDYAFRPNREERTFGEQMVHIAQSQAYRFAQLTGNRPAVDLNSNFPAHDRAAVVKLLQSSFDFVIEQLPKMTPAQLDKMYSVKWPGRPEANGRQMIMNMFMHTAHHRSQCEVYLRIKNIAPPVYAF